MPHQPMPYCLDADIFRHLGNQLVGRLRQMHLGGKIIKDHCPKGVNASDFHFLMTMAVVLLLIDTK